MQAVGDAHNVVGAVRKLRAIGAPALVQRRRCLRRILRICGVLTAIVTVAVAASENAGGPCFVASLLVRRGHSHTFTRASHVSSVNIGREGVDSTGQFAVAASALVATAVGVALQDARMRRRRACVHVCRKANPSQHAPAVVGENRPAADQPEANKQQTKWNCTGCGAANFLAVDECHKCGAVKSSNVERILVSDRDRAKDELSEVTEAFVRLQADLQNYRRKHAESMKHATDLGERDVLRKLVPISHEIDEALILPEAMTEKEASLFNSYSLLFMKVHDAFAKCGVVCQVVEVGGPYDPLLHRMSGTLEPNSEHPEGTILEVVRPGWTYDGRVLIASEVIVAAKTVTWSSDEQAPMEENEADGEVEEVKDR
eukprot:TRINITY_DN38492_c0_g2_i1.p1 TRINITY_DN38492_c0_g2~~TRINITY_DN38492_c0_g2_i1.p1  ORF type:complete len:372 (-),score=56.93 TRINITY_DN38492_c0_g2_i1:124-1239(-)